VLVVGGGLDVGVLGFALVVVAEGEEVSVVEGDPLRVEGAVEVGTRVVVIQGTAGDAPLVGTMLTFVHEVMCPCSFGC
jgi:Trk K+ transport system NAD-binding subunit